MQPKGLVVRYTVSKFFLRKVLRRLTTTESFNEAFTIVEGNRPQAFKEGSLIAARAEKVFKFQFFFSFPIQGFSHPHGNHPSKVSQLPSQTSQRCNFKVKVNHSNHVHDLVTCNPIHNFFPL